MKLLIKKCRVYHLLYNTLDVRFVDRYSKFDRGEWVTKSHIPSRYLKLYVIEDIMDIVLGRGYHPRLSTPPNSKLVVMMYNYYRELCINALVKSELL